MDIPIRLRQLVLSTRLCLPDETNQSHSQPSLVSFSSHATLGHAPSAALRRFTRIAPFESRAPPCVRRNPPRYSGGMGWGGSRTVSVDDRNWLWLGVSIDRRGLYTHAPAHGYEAWGSWGLRCVPAHRSSLQGTSAQARVLLAFIKCALWSWVLMFG